MAVAELAGRRALRRQVAAGAGEGEAGEEEGADVTRLAELLMWTAEGGGADVAASIQGQL